MRKIILYIASSLDGKIADLNGNIGWLESIPNPDKLDYGYHAFYDSIDATLMGNKTYRQVLGFDTEYPYKGKNNYVITRNKSLTKDDHVTYVSENAVRFINQLKTQPGKDIWCVGGGQLNAILLDNGLLDEIRVFIMPIILGAGIPFTSRLNSFVDLELIESNKYSSGVMEMRYNIKHNPMDPT